MKSKALFLATAAMFAVTACKPVEKAAEKPADAAASPTQEAAAASEAAPAEAVGATTAVDPGSVTASTGIPVCDAYLEKVYACVSNKIPVAQRDMIKNGIEQSRASWAAVTDKAALAAQCKTAMDEARTSLAAFGCTL